MMRNDGIEEAIAKEYYDDLVKIVNKYLENQETQSKVHERYGLYKTIVKSVCALICVIVLIICVCYSPATNEITNSAVSYSGQNYKSEVEK